MKGKGECLMGKKVKVKQSSKTKTTVVALAVAAPLLTLALALLGARLMLSGMVGQERLTALGCAIAALVALFVGLLAAQRAPQKKLLWGLAAAGCYACALLLGNLLFFGEGYHGVLPIVGCCMGGGLLGSLTAAAKRRKYR